MDRKNLEDYHNTIYNAASSESFMRKFRKHSKAGDREAMVEMVLLLDKTSEFEINLFYKRKNNELAERLFNEIDSVDGHSGEVKVLQKVDLLTKALFAVDSRNVLYIEILTARARHCFSIGLYSKCFKDCDHVLEKLDQFGDSLEEPGKYRELCVLLKNQCKKFSGKHKIIMESSVKLPKIDGKTNRKLKTCSDALAWSYDETRGRHLLATRNIKAGTVLIVDEPFGFSTDESALMTNCLHCHVSLQLIENIRLPCENCQTVSFCSEKCRKASWSNYHQYECSIFDNFLETNKNHFNGLKQRSHWLLAYRTTVAKAVNKESNTLDSEFLCYQDAKSLDARRSLQIDIESDIYDPLDYRTVYSLETHCEKARVDVNLSRSIKSVFLAKCLAFVLSELEDTIKETVGPREIVFLAIGMMRHVQAVDCNAYEIVENVLDRNTKTWEPRNVGGAVFTTVSLVNHSCYPNIVRHSYPGGKVVVRSLRFIGKGSEILDCYGPHFITDALTSRQQYLTDKYHFICTCEPCSADWKLPFSEELTIRCVSCGDSVDSARSRCTNCSLKVDVKKIDVQLAKSTKKRLGAVTKMFDGQYWDALVLLLEHASFVDKYLVAPSIEAIKTQQSIIQCYNSLSNIGP